MVVAVEMETAGELLLALTTFFSCVAVSSQRSTCKMKNEESTSLQRVEHMYNVAGTSGMLLTLGRLLSRYSCQ